MHFGTKSYLKSNRNHTVKHARRTYHGKLTKAQIGWKNNITAGSLLLE